ncbi:hypothetical protein EPN29_06480 [bacterium]|nr:MAG: hypothetical protein EPN29_06480 [bacterium]
MAGDPGGLSAPPPQTRFSADGFWWWDGAEWKPALSQDRLWRWNGQAWEPAGGIPATGSRTGAAVAIGITVAVFAGVLVLVSILVMVVLYTMGAQISNIFSNVAAALGSPP